MDGHGGFLIALVAAFGIGVGIIYMGYNMPEPRSAMPPLDVGSEDTKGAGKTDPGYGVGRIDRPFSNQFRAPSVYR